MRIGLILGAGGSVGVAYHGAVLASLERTTGWDPRTSELIVGTSAGSISAAMLRAGVPAGDLLGISEGLPLSEDGARLAAMGRPHMPRPRAWDALRMRPVADPFGVLHALAHPRSHPAAALASALMASGGIPTTAISAGIDSLFGGVWPDEGLWVCAVDLRTGRRVVFGQEGAPVAGVGLAVAASSAIPGYFEPVCIGRHRYVDGGVCSLVNLDLVAGLELDLVIVSSPLSQASPSLLAAPTSFVRRPLRARLHAEAAELRRAGTPVFLVEPGATVTASMGLNPMDAARRGAVSRATTRAVGEWLRVGGQGRKLASLLACAAAEGADPPSPGPVLLRRPSA